MDIGANWLSFAAIGAAFGFIGTMWSKIKAIFWRFIGLFVITVEIDADLYNYLCGWLMKNCHRWGNYEKSYTNMWEFWRKRRRHGNTPTEIYGSKSMLLWYGWRPIYFATGPTGDNNGSGGQNNAPAPTLSAARLYFLRYTVDIDDIIAKASRWSNNLNWDVEDGKLVGAANQRYFIQRIPDYKNGDKARSGNGKSASIWQYGRYRPIGLTLEDIGWEPPPGDTSLERLVFPEKIMTVLEEIKRWSKSRDWYTERGIPWKKGCMFYGPPGTGKTALARAFAQDLDMPLWVYDLSELDNAKLVKAWAQMRHSAPCIALIEDIDNVFHGRENVSRNATQMMFPQTHIRHQPTQGQPQMAREDDDEDFRPRGVLSFDCLLNVLDGVEDNEGVFTIITTNKLEHIDEAIGRPRENTDGSVEFISTRPGRIDKAIELTFMTPECKVKLAKKILKECPEALEEICSSFSDQPETPAQIQERCGQAALRYYWEGREA